MPSAHDDLKKACNLGVKEACTMAIHQDELGRRLREDHKQGGSLTLPNMGRVGLFHQMGSSDEKVDRFWKSDNRSEVTHGG
jgi:hypothetical protein